MTPKNTIYAYTEARPGHKRFGEVRYVGRDCQSGARAFNYMAHNHRRVGHAVRAHRKLGLRPGVVILQVLSDDATLGQVNEAERYWVREHRLLGADLWNVTEGG